MIFYKISRFIISTLLIPISISLVGCKDNATKEIIENTTLNENAHNYEAKDIISGDLQQFIRNLTASEEEYKYYLNKEVDYDYSAYVNKIEGKGIFLSKYTKVFENINGRDVTVDSFLVRMGQNINHPNVGMGILLYQAILHKLSHPDVDNEIAVTSFHMSTLAGVNVLPSSKYFGTMKNMINEPIDRDGFVRFSYLMAFAARLGINVNVINQINGYSDYGTEISPLDYFSSIKDTKCINNSGKTIDDFLNYRCVDWISYGDKAAADMFHLKTCLVRYYEDYDGNEHEFGSFFTSSNLDGVNANGTGGHVYNQTGVIITNHDYIYYATRNFVELVLKYCGINQAPIFRSVFKKLVEEQKNIVARNGYEGIKDTMVFYSGSSNDPVFEICFTPLYDDIYKWNNELVFSRYVNKLVSSNGPIKFLWHNPKGDIDFGFMEILLQKVNNAFMIDRGHDINLKNELCLKMTNYYGAHFSYLKEGNNVGLLHLEGNAYPHSHEKDCFVSYYDNGKNNVLILNSLNMHQGAFNYQINQILTIKENELTGLDFTDNFYDMFLSLY